MKQEQRFELKNQWFDFLNLAIVTAVICGVFLVIVQKFNMFGDSRWLANAVIINIGTLVITALSIISFIHYKNTSNNILISQHSISIPVGKFFPEKLFIEFDNIIFENRFSHGSDEIYSIVYNGGSIEMKKSKLKNHSDWKKLVYELKEVIH